MHSLVDKAEARREHEPSRDGIGDTEPPAGGVLRESEWHGTEPGGNRREQREEKDRSCANRFHTPTLLGAAVVREFPPSDLGLWIDQQRPGRRIFALGCGIDLPLQPSKGEPPVPNSVLHLGYAPQATPREICGEDYHRPGLQLDERLTDRPVQPSLYRIRDVPRAYHLSPLPGILSSLGDGPDIPQGAARLQEFLMRPRGEHHPFGNGETCAGEQVQELPTRVV